MKALISEMKWSDKSSLSKETLLLVAIALAGIFAYVRIRPLFETTIQVVTAPEQSHEASSSTSAAKVLPELLPAQIRDSSATERRSFGYSAMPATAKQDPTKPSVLERPLFDGLAVNFRAILLHALSSQEPSAPVEARIIESIGEDSSSSADLSSVRGARIVGTFSPNFATKRLNISFAELVSAEGRSYTVAGAAFDPDTRSIGTVANSSSGLPSRLAGIALDRAIVATDQVAMAKLFSLGTDNSSASKELQKAMVDTNQQASMSLSAEATKDLRETQAELSLPAGALLSVRIRSAQPGGSR